MKKSIILILAVVALAFTSCDKDTDDVSNTGISKLSNTDLIGTWNWVGTDGGIGAHIHDTPASTNKSFKFIISKNYSYELFEGNVSKSVGTYKLVLGNSIYTGKTDRLIELSDTNYVNPLMVSSGVIYINDKSELTIADNFYDGVATRFSK